MIYLIVGPDRYLAETEVRRIQANADPDGLNSIRFDKTTSLGEIESAVSTMGFFGTGRLIIAEGVIARASGAAKAKKAEIADVARIFTAIAPGNTLILIDSESGSIPKAIESEAGPDAITFAGRAPRGIELEKWVAGRARELGGSIGRKEGRHLLDRRFPGQWGEPGPRSNPLYDVPPDLQLLNSELEKLVVATLDRAIEIDDIDALISTETEDRIFPLLDAIMQGNAAEAFRMAGDQRSDDESSARVLNQLAANAEMGQIAVHFSGEAELVAIAKAIGVSNPKRLSAIKRNLSGAGATSLATDVLESDRRLKTGIVRSPSAQFQDVVVRRASKTRGR